MLLLGVPGMLVVWVIWAVVRIRRIMDHAERGAERLSYMLPGRSPVRRDQVIPWSRQELLGQPREMYRHGDARN